MPWTRNEGMDSVVLRHGVVDDVVGAGVGLTGTYRGDARASVSKKRSAGLGTAR